MTTTRNETGSRHPEFAKEALQVLASIGIPFALLHNEERIARGEIASDVDLICDVEFSVLFELIANPLRNAGFRPIVVWPYDTGSTTLFVTNSDATRGAQLDFLWDRAGRGTYGLHLRRLLPSLEVGVAFPRVSPLHELLYLARKRQVKEQWEECRSVLDQLSGIPAAVSEVDQAFVGRVRDEIKALIEGELVSVRPRPRRAISEARRIVDRARRPAGAWVEVTGSERPDTVARGITNRFGGLLPHVGWGRRPRVAPVHLHWLAREVAPVRWRAGIYASWTDREGRRPAPDCAVNAREGVDAAIRGLVTWLEHRLLP